MRASVRRVGGIERVELIEDDEPAARARPAPGRAAGTTAEPRAGDPEPGGPRRDDETATADDTPVDPPAHSHASPRLRRARRFALGAAALLVVGLVATQLVVDARARARAARYADVTGVLAPLRPDLQVLWRTAEPDSSSLYGWTTRTTVGDVVLSSTRSDAGSVTFEGLDAATGEVLWSQDVPLPGGVPSEDAYGGGQASCTATALYRRVMGQAPPDAGEPEADDTAVCLISNPTFMVDIPLGDSSWSQVTVGYTTVLVVEATTGAVTELAELPYGVHASPLLDGYVTSTPDVLPDPTWESADQVPQVTSTVSRYVWGESEPRWSFSTGPQDPTDGDWLSATADSGRMNVSIGSTTWVVDDDEGTVVETTPGDGLGWTWRTPLPGGASVVQVSDADGSTRTTFVTATGARKDLGETSLVQAYPDDGSAGSLLLAREGGLAGVSGALTAIDTTTGERVWTSEVAASWWPIVLDGTVYTASGRTLSAVDAEDGAVLWSTSLQRSDGQLLTDGSVVVVSTEGRLDAYHREDGSAAWSAAIVEGDDGLQLTPVRDGPTGAPTKDDGSRWATAPDGYVSPVGRRLALQTGTGGLVVFG